MLLGSSTAQAQAPTITALSPGRNAPAAPRTSNVAATFSQPLSNSAATLGSVKVFSQQAGGQKAGTATVSGNTLSFNPSSDFKAGETVFATITAAAQSSGGISLAKPQVFQFTAATAPAPATFSGQSAAVASSPDDVVTGDLDGDGDLDFITIDYSASSNNVSIRLNNGSGVFAGGPNLSVGSDAYKAALGDVDADGDLDLLISYFRTAGIVSVRLNDGNANFSLKQEVSVGSSALDLALGDVDGDGDLDLLTANYDNQAGVASVRLNDGTGTFGGSSEVSVGFFASDLVVGDIDNDGDLDLLINATSRLPGSNPYQVAVRLNNGTGSLSGTQTLNLPHSADDMVLGDADGDGDLDLVTLGPVTETTGAATVSFNNGAGSFSNGPDVTVGNGSSLALGDMDGDGDLDLLAANANANTVSLRRNNGSGLFSGSQDIPAGGYARTLTTGDLDNDGDLDFLTTSDGVIAVRLNQGAPTITGLSASSGVAGASITIAGTNLAGTTSVTFGGVAATNFVVTSATQLTVTVPAGALSGPVIVTTLVGSSNSVSFTVTQNLAVTSVSPARNARSAPRRGPVTVTLNQPLSNNASTLGSLKVFSQQAGGRKVGATTVSGNTLSFVPTTEFKAGETVQATLTGAAQSTGGGAATPHVFQFTTATSPSTGVFGGGSEVSVGGNPFAVSNSLATGDVDGDGDLDFVAANGLINTVSVRLNNGAGSFSGSQEVAVGNIPLNVALGDLDSDGDLDLLVVNQGTAASNFAGSVSIRLNNGTGSFSGSQEVLVGRAPYDVTLGDVDGDGDLDFVSPNGSSSVSVRLNDGNGTFTSGSEVPVGSFSYTTALTDVDNDGDLDLLAASYSGSILSVRLNNGNGTFTGNQNVSAGGSPNGLAVGDIDGDGDVDLLTTSYLEFRGVDIRLNDGAGNFSGTQRLPLPDGATSLSLSDVDGDGDLDLLALNYRPLQSLSVRLNNGLGSFSGSQQVAFPVSTQGLKVGDLDNDGDLDLLVRSDNSNTVSVRLNGATTLLPTALFPTRNARSAPRNTDVAVTFNQPLLNNPATQGALKVFGQQSGLKAGPAAVSSNTLTLNPNTDFRPGEKVWATLTTGVQSSTSNLPAAQVFQFTAAAAPGSGAFIGGSDAEASNSSRLAIGDLDGDGDLDYVTYSGAVRLNDGTGLYTNGQQISIFGPRNVALADIDSDGDLDALFSINTGLGFVLVRLNNGAATFSGTQQVSVGFEPYGLALGDIDGDGDLDLLTANGSSASVSVRLNNGLGTFSGTGSVAVGTQPTSLVVGDLDNDGDLDLLAGNVGTNTVAVRFNDGLGSFSGSQSVTVGFNPNNLALGDVDGDGDLDFVTSNYNTYVNGQRANGNVSVVLNDGFGSFGESQQVALGGTPLDVTLGDIDGDGDLDLATANGGSTLGATASVRLNNGLGSFSGSQEVSVSLQPGSVVLADTDGDGDLDLLTGGTNNASVRLNQSTSALLAVTAVLPARNAPAAPRTAPVAVTFNQALSTSAANQNAISVFGTQGGGRKAGTTTVAGNTLSFAPTAGFKPGETIYATVTSAVRSTGNQTLLTPQVFQFTAATAPSSATFGGGSEPRVGVNPQATTVGDVDGDGDLDLLTVSYETAGSVSVRLNNGLGSFSAAQEVAVGYNPYYLTLGDMDGDGDLDLLTANAGGPNGIISIVFNNGTGLFTLLSQISVGNNPHTLAVGDIDGDGDLDLLAANYTAGNSTTSSTISVRLNNGRGVFSPAPNVSVDTRPVSLALGDVDNDGDLDLLSAGSNTTTVSLRLNDGRGSFSGTTEISTAYNPEVVTLGDVDNDGDLDLVTAHVVSNVVVVRLNDESGVFSGTVPLVVGLQAPRGLALGDADGDGDLDILVANSGSNTVSVRLNNGAGTFGGNSQVPVGSAPIGLAIGDLDGNGTLDFATCNKGTNTASVRLNAPSAVKVLTSAPASLAAQIELYPNPAHESVRLLLSTELVQQSVQLSVVNTLGQVVLTQPLSARQTVAELNLGHLSKGVYSVCLRTASGLITKRLVIE
ncbi:hypothetical protein GCM10011383_22760 [Hymenobacter cavernae]|uniref:T9SS C-terminal target domain-containing protein n=1 Tax=Hymenobacter cavernae TaxID=2044852 RepID=A0ABQ1U540_9BACT|nr:hypothetical protein GCM10011383_22760 [Hymenobacter cavernae]